MIQNALKLQKATLRKAICFLLAFVILTSLFPIAMFAFEAEEGGGYLSESAIVTPENVPLYDAEEPATTMPDDLNYEDIDYEEIGGLGFVGIMPLSSCCLSPDTTHSGHMGNLTAAQSPTGVAIAGAPWEFCANCGTVTIEGGGAQTASMSLNQSRFPDTIRPDITHIIFTEPVIGGTILYDLFHDLPNLEGITGLHYLDTSHTQRFSRMFRDTPSVTSGINLHLDLTSFDTGNAVSMYAMFAASGVITIDTTGWDTSGLTGTSARDGFNSMFWGARNLTTIIGVNDFDTSNAQRFSRMFQSAYSLTNLDPHDWNTSNVTLMYHTFNGVGRDTGIPIRWDLSNWDVSNVLRMDNMFANMWWLEELNVSGWNTSSVVNMNSMFRSARSLTELDLSSWDTRQIIGNNTNLIFGEMNHPGEPLSLRVLHLGENWRVPSELSGTGNSNILVTPAPPNTVASGYYGLWVRVGAGTIHNPLDLFPALTNIQFRDDNVRPTPTPASGQVYTWVWQPRVPHFAVNFVSSGNGTVTPAQTLVPITNPASTIESALVITTAPSVNHVFLHWTSNQHAGIFTTEEIKNLPIEADTIFTANFARYYTVTFVHTPANGGSLTGNVPVEVIYTQTIAVASGSVPTAVPASGWSTNHLWISSDPLHIGGPFTAAQVSELSITTDTTFTLTFVVIPPNDDGQPPSPPEEFPEPYVPLAVMSPNHHAYIIGFPDGSVRPNANITRAEVATIIFRLMCDDFRVEIWSQTNPFPDVATQDWFNNAISTLTNAGVLVGYPDGNFRPNQSMTRAEFSALLVRSLGNGKGEDTPFTDVSGHWAEGYIYVAYAFGWVQGFGDGTFRPNQFITRAEVAALVNRSLGRLPETPEDLLPGMVIWSDNMNTNAWYYLYIQEATNSHYHEMKANGIYETWTELITPREWWRLERPYSDPRIFAGLYIGEGWE